jgi:hypothetical protein
VAHPRFKDGKRSRYLRDVPQKLKAGYVASRQDEEITSIREELAIQTALIRKRLADLKTQQIPPWTEAVEALNDLKLAAVKDKAARFATLERIIRTGHEAWEGEHAIIDDIREMLQERARLAVAEHHREIDLRSMVPVEVAYAFLARIMEAIKEVITDRDVFRRLNQRVMQLLPASPPNGHHHASAPDESQN